MFIWPLFGYPRTVHLLMYRQPAQSTDTVSRLQGMRDLSEESWHHKIGLQDRLRNLLSGYGYRLLETPVLEPTELFLRKSGGELASHLYSFTDAGSNAVSLRPEFTSPIMRHYLENADKISLPARWQYCGPVFRFDVSHPEASGQFTQVGGELIGSSEITADVELLNLAVGVSTQLGLDGWSLQLADLEILDSLLDPVGVSARARSFIIQNMPRLREGRSAVPRLLEEGRHLHLVGGSNGNGDPEDVALRQAVHGLDDAQARSVLLGLLQWNSADQLGQRTPEDVVERLLSKIRGADSEENLRRGLELASDLAAIKGEPGQAVESVRKTLASADANQDAVDRLSEVVGLISSGPDARGRMVLDFGLVRGMAYYNGVIFEVSHPGWPGALGGGGRYDTLSRALGGGEAVPALGFAYNLDALISLGAS
ncbi:MAG: ATP phosphoribosyltransferase regulatory subunit [Chloroflexi bacterium]|nr:ATP phosphoribosyltransferase regulatory subunit [Chloroflexota bacterium]